MTQIILSTSETKHTRSQNKRSMIRFILMLFISVILGNNAFAQWSGNGPVYTYDKVVIGKNNPSASALLTLDNGKIAAPSGNSNGMKIKLWESTTSSLYNYGIGINSGELWILRGKDSRFAIYENNTTPQADFLIDKNGKVGIGTTNPQQDFHINSSDGTPSSIRLQGMGKNWSIAGGDRLYFANYSNNTYHDYLVITTNGNVGIGTTSPQSKLAVKGKITAQEVEVTLSGWADFVFDNDYQLKSLYEVEQYIAENKHLPDVPSEEAVMKEGINLGDMDAILLRKIEELTLHVIDLKKENDLVKAELTKLKKQN